MQENLFDTVLPNALAGFRLRRFEVLNWGSFDQKVWKIEPNGGNALLTGDVGSGKSTLVDAVTTLLVPHQRITYNKAAGAEAKERTLYSYIRGEYKNEKDNEAQASKAVMLRDYNNYTVLLAEFYNDGYAQSVTLAQVFWLKTQGRNPERFFIVAQSSLSLTQHFTGCTDVLDLKKRLRKTPSTEVVDTFREYSGKFRHLFGIENDQALELFYQTISLKTVGNLTSFVRAHMLEPDDVEPRIEELRQNFENLNRSHGAVLKAKHQIELLQPIVEEGSGHAALQLSVSQLRNCRESLEGYFAEQKVALLDSHITELSSEIARLTQRIDANRAEFQHLDIQARALKDAIHQQGGTRLETIAQEIQQATSQRDRARQLSGHYETLVKKLGMRAARDEAAFVKNRTQATGLQEQAEGELSKLGELKVRNGIALQDLKTQIEGLRLEIASLKRRRSNIPSRNLELREAMCEAVEASESELPFAGELLQVGEKAAAWEGAIERLLHGFALSLLVPDRLYERIAHYVDLTQLRGRLVYYRAENSHSSPSKTIPVKTVAGKLLIKQESEYQNWLERELTDRFDHVCCDSIDEFRRHSFAITQKGQIKSGGRRHEKDDRQGLNDRGNYVLGWSNQAKIEALESIEQTLIGKAQLAADEWQKLNEKQLQEQARRDDSRDLLKFASFPDIHWQAFATRIQDLEAERKRIEESSDVLKTLQAQLKNTEASLGKIRENYETFLSNRGAAQGRLESSREQREAGVLLRDAIDPARREADFPQLALYHEEALPEFKLTVLNLDKATSTLRDFLQRRIDSENKRIERLTEKLVRQMQQYKSAYPAETTEADASLEALPEFVMMLAKLSDEDLPRHESRFKQLLNEGTIHSVALLQNHLERSRKSIEDKVSAINRSLREIEYGPGTYIELVHDRAPDREIREFQQDLKRCLAHGLQEQGLYNETRFLQVKGILDRLNGREAFAEIDRRWTIKVTDVRNWYEFSASERWKEDETEKEFYSDSAGKSGGQKEKLAYTILASALAYQFGLEWNVTRSRSFRFVLIDEAFGRGSDESARYGLELFKKLNLQLLVVTPLQKIHIIEDYVQSVHYVHNEDGCNSVIRNLSIEEFRAERERHQLAQESSRVVGEPA